MLEFLALGLGGYVGWLNFRWNLERSDDTAVNAVTSVIVASLVAGLLLYLLGLVN